MIKPVIRYQVLCFLFVCNLEQLTPLEPCSLQCHQTSRQEECEGKQGLGCPVRLLGIRTRSGAEVVPRGRRGPPGGRHTSGHPQRSRSRTRQTQSKAEPGAQGPRQDAATSRTALPILAGLTASEAMPRCPQEQSPHCSHSAISLYRERERHQKRPSSASLGEGRVARPRGTLRGPDLSE